MGHKLTIRFAQRRWRHAFTLIELMIVLVILGLLTALVAPNFVGKAEKAKHRAAQVQVKLLVNCVRDYYLDMDVYPQRLEDLIQNPGEDRWDGPYLDPARVPLDPWGESYYYEPNGQHGRFDIYSYGADKSPGGEKVNADVTSWE